VLNQLVRADSELATVLSRVPWKRAIRTVLPIDVLSVPALARLRAMQLQYADLCLVRYLKIIILRMIYQEGWYTAQKKRAV